MVVPTSVLTPESAHCAAADALTRSILGRPRRNRDQERRFPGRLAGGGAGIGNVDDGDPVFELRAAMV